jgi:hypothetical protein
VKFLGGEFVATEAADRRVYAVEDMTPEQIIALQQAEVPAEYAYLDDELKDWQP